MKYLMHILEIILIFLPKTIFADPLTMLNANRFATLVKSVQVYLSSPSVILLNSNYDRGDFRLYLKQLTKEELILSTSLPIPMLLRELEKEDCKCKNHLYVVPVTDTMSEDVEKFFTRLNLSIGRWLVLLDNAISIANFTVDVYIPINSQFLIVQVFNETSSSKNVKVLITEIYHIHPDIPLQAHILAEWYTDDEIVWSSNSYWQRRGNLRGVTVKTALLPHPMLQKIIERRGNEAIKMKGVMSDLWNEIQRRLNIRTSFYIPSDSVFGSKNATGTWTGILGMIVRKEVDVGTAAFMYTQERLDVVDFFPPMWNLKEMVYIKEPDIDEGDIYSVFSTFSAQLWCIILITLTLLTLSLSTTWPLGQRISPTTTQRILESYHNVFGIFCQQGLDQVPNSWSSRLVLFTTYLTAIVVFIAYSATFISFLTIRKSAMPFTDFQGMLKDGTYRIGLLSGSAHLNIFEKSKEKVLRLVYKRLIERSDNILPRNDMEGLLNVCNLHKYGFLVSDRSVSGISPSLPCRIVGVPRAYYTSTMSMILNKGNPFKKLFSHHLLDIRSTGLLRRIEDNRVPHKLKGDSVEEINPRSMTLDTLVLIFVILFVGIILSIVILLFEIGSMKFCHKNLRNYLIS